MQTSATDSKVTEAAIVWTNCPWCGKVCPDQLVEANNYYGNDVPTDAHVAGRCTVAKELRETLANPARATQVRKWRAYHKWAALAPKVKSLAEGHGTVGLLRLIDQVVDSGSGYGSATHAYNAGLALGLFLIDEGLSELSPAGVVCGACKGKGKTVVGDPDGLTSVTCEGCSGYGVVQE